MHAGRRWGSLFEEQEFRSKVIYALKLISCMSPSISQHPPTRFTFGKNKKKEHSGTMKLYCAVRSCKIIQQSQVLLVVFRMLPFACF